MGVESTATERDDELVEADAAMALTRLSEWSLGFNGNIEISCIGLKTDKLQECGDAIEKPSSPVLLICAGRGTTNSRGLARGDATQCEAMQRTPLILAATLHHERVPERRI